MNHAYLGICEQFITAGALDPRSRSLKQAPDLKELFSEPVFERQILERFFGEREADRLLALRPLELRDKTAGARSGVFGRLASLFAK